VPRSHTVVAGDCCTSLAFAHGFADHAKIHDDDANAALKAERPNPNVLRVGDVVTLPDPAPKEHDGATDATHRFTVTRPRAHLRLLLRDEAGNALGDTAYVLTIVGLDPIEGRTAGDGTIDHPIPAGARRGTLTVRPQEDDGVDGWELPLELGALEHESSTSAAKTRLMNLGFDCGGETDDIDDATRAAVRGFRALHSLGDGDALDDATRDRLRTEHEGE
jgi:hypothetical protein